MKVFLHCGSDQVIILNSEWKKVFVKFNDLERSLPRARVDFLEGKTIDTIYVLNGPGSFTLLRIVSICINLTQAKIKAEIIDIPKFDLYHELMNQQLIPWIWVIFAGQRKKLFVLQQWDTEQADLLPFNSETWLPDPLSSEYRIQSLKDHPVLQMLDSSKMFEYSWMDDETLWIKFDTKRISFSLVDLEKLWTQVETLEPHYAQAPV